MSFFQKRPSSTWSFWSANWDSHYPMILVSTDHKIADRGSSIYLTVQTDGSVQCSDGVTVSYRDAPNITGRDAKSVKKLYRKIIQEVLNDYISKYDNLNTIADYFHLDTDAYPSMETAEGRTSMILNAITKFVMEKC